MPGHPTSVPSAMFEDQPGEFRDTDLIGMKPCQVASIVLSAPDLSTLAGE